MNEIELHKRIKDLEDKIQKDQEQSQQTNADLKQKLQDIDNQLYDLKSQMQQQQSDNAMKQYIIDKIFKEQINFKKYIEQLQEELGNTKTQANLQISRSVINTNQNSQQVDQQIYQELENQIKKGKEDIKKVKDDLNKKIKALEDKLDNTEKELENSNQQCDKEHQYFMESRDEILKLQKIISQKDKKIKQLENQSSNCLVALRYLNMDKQRLEEKINVKDLDITALHEEIKLLKEQTNLLKQLLYDSSKGKKINIDQNQQYQILVQQQNWLIEKRQKQEELLNREHQQREQERKNRLWEQAQQQLKQGTALYKTPREKEGAMEALCKQGNFYKFEEQPNVKTLKTKFEVWRVELKDQAFNENIETIEIIQCPQDFSKNNEGSWDCIRTEKPFAFGMMKDVFLMKKLNATEELYVIKTPIGCQPYKTMDDALKECKSHLICQKLMKKFVSELQEQKVEKKKNLQIPKAMYNDLLILKESKNSFWIAERFFKGEFVKYNNNYGFIHEDHQLELNKFAQSFTYYTYFISNFNYMVSDVQGVGNYFTDPTINTRRGNFDDTDMGQEGQMMYLVNYENKKTLLTYEYLDLLGIYE